VSPEDYLDLVDQIAMPVTLALYAATVLAFIKILRRVGLSPWWAAVAFVPVANLVAFWTFPWARWPLLPEKSEADKHSDHPMPSNERG